MAQQSYAMLSQFTDNVSFQSKYIYKNVIPKKNLPETNLSETKKKKKKQKQKQKQKIFDYNDNAVYEKEGVHLLMTGISVLMESKDIVQVLSKGNSPIILKVHDWECQGSNTEMVVEPLVLIEEDCATLDYYCHNKDTKLDILFQAAPQQNMYMFSTSMKSFLSECIRLIIAQSEEGVHMKVFAKEILYTKEGYFKLYNLSNRCDSIMLSVNSFKEIVQTLQNAAKLRQLVLADEVSDLYTSCDALYPQSIYRHPSLLLKGEKLMLIRRMCTCFEEGKIKTTIGCPKWIFDSIDKFESFEHLVNIKGISGETDEEVRFLVRRLRHMSEHINDYVKKNEHRNVPFSPLEFHRKTDLYSDHEVECIIEIIFPKLLSLLHLHAKDYSAFKE